jgi:hypothetical protein
MRSLVRVVAAMQVALIFPAALFLASVLVAVGGEPPYAFAHLARRVVAWYSGRMWTLWLLLLALPFGALATGCATLINGWSRDAGVSRAPRQSVPTISASLATLFVAGMTMTSAGILVIVVLHMLAN